MVSKKSTWRKKCRVEGIDDLSVNQEMNFENVPDEELFVVDRSRKKKTLSIKEKRKLYEKKPPTCFSILEERSNVPDPLIKRNIVKQKEKKLNAKKLTKSIEARSKSLEVLLKRPKKFTFTDLWASNTEQCDKKPPKTLKQSTSVLPAIEVPHPGTSYNPTLKDHLDLLNIVDEKLVHIRKKKKHLDRTVTNMLPTISSTKLEAMRLDEMSEGLSAMRSTQSDEDSGDESDYKAVNPPVVNKKKDGKKRRKISERRKLAREKILDLKERQKLNQLKKLNKIKREIQKKEAFLEKRKLKREKKKIKQKLEDVKRLGSVKYREPIPVYPHPHDLIGNLRSVKQEGSLLTEQYNQLQKRNIIKPSRKYFRKTAKMKSFIHGDDKLPINDELRFI